MFKNEKIDCLSICTLVDSHLKLVKEAIENGVKGIFLEKPMSDTLKNTKSIIDLCKKEKVSLLIDHKRRFDPFYESVRKLILEKKLGTIQLINVYYGAGVSNTGSHLFDLIRFFFGDVISVKSNSSKNVSNNPSYPNIDVVLELHENIECKIHALNYNPYAIFEMDILGTDGRMRLNLISNKIEYFKVQTDKYFVYRDLSPSKIKVATSNPSPLLLAVQNMVNVIDKREEPQCSGFDGYKSLELIIACIESSRNQKKYSFHW
jgi:predicted dehydrogenase